MFCGKCGKSLPDNVSFCPNCGAKILLPEGLQNVDSTLFASPSIEKAVEKENTFNSTNDINEIMRSKGKFNKKIVLIVSAALVVIFAFILFRNSKSEQVSNKYATICYLSDGVFHIQDAHGKILHEETTSSSSYRITNAIGSGNFVVSGIGGTYYWTGQDLKWLYFCSDYMMTLNGSAVAVVSSYRQTTNDDESTAVNLQRLSIYRKDGGGATIVNDAPEMSIDLRCVSPDGSCVGYTITQDDVTNGYIYIDNQATKLGIDKYPVAISQNGKYVYYIKDEGGSTRSLYIQEGTDNESKNRIGREFYSESNESYNFCNNECFLLLNRDGNEAIAQVGGATFYCKGNDEVEKVADDILYPIIPSQYTEICDDYQNFRSSSLFMVWVDSLSKQLFMYPNYTDETIDIVKLSAGNDIEKVIQSIKINEESICEVSANMNTITYIDDDVLYRYSVDEDKKEKIANEVRSFVASIDGKTVFYINDDFEMYRKEGDGGSKLLMDNVYEDLLYFGSIGSSGVQNDRLYGIFYSAWRQPVYDDIMFFWKDSTLYQFGEDTTEVLFDEPVSYCKPLNNAICLTTWRNSTRYYISFDGKEFMEITYNGL